MNEAQGAPPDVARLVREHHAAVYRYALRLSGKEADAEDLVQATFLKAQSAAAQLRDPSKARSWLFSILRNLFQMQLRKQSQLEVVYWGPELAEAAEDAVVESVDHEELHKALAEIPESFRLVLAMFYFEELSYRQIAEKLGAPEGTVMSRLSRAKEHLKARLVARETAASSLGPSPAGDP